MLKIWLGFSCAVILAARFSSGEQIGEGRPPMIGAVTRSVAVREGSAVNLRCPADGAPPLEYQWEKVQPTGGWAAVGVYSLSDALDFGPAERVHAGVYRCIARNSHGAFVSDTVTLTIAYVGLFEESAQSGLFRANTARGGHFILHPPRLAAAPADQIRWQWFFNDSAVSMGSRHYISTRGDLVVLDARRGDAGAYRAEATHALLAGKRAVSADYRVSVSEPLRLLLTGDPVIVLAPQDVEYLADPSDADAPPIVLECVAQSGTPEDVRVRWSQNGSAIVLDGVRFRTEQFDRRLVISNPRYPDSSGFYECTATNSKQDRKTAWIKIIEAPSMGEGVRPTTHGALGQPLRLGCEARGTPPLLVRWMHNARLIVDRTVMADGTLVLDALSASSEGVYQCIASNAAGVALASTWLTASASAPVLLTAPQNLSVVSGQQVDLPCLIGGAPNPVIRWTLNDTDIAAFGLMRFRVEDDKLVIPMPTVDYTGWYKCVGRNTEGTAESRAFVHVAGRTQIVNGPVDQSVVIGSMVVFPCEVAKETGSSEFSRHWYFENQLVTSGSMENVQVWSNGSLHVDSARPRHIGLYSCTVTSAYGTQTQSGNLFIVERPGMPVEVGARLLNDSLPARVLVQWSAGFDGNLPIIKYVVHLRVLGVQDLWSDWEAAADNVPAERRESIIDNLKPSAVYQFRVVAINQLGASMPSIATINMTMPQQPPAAAPRSVAGSARSSTSIMVQWQPPPADQWNGDIVGYLVRYRLANYPNTRWQRRNITDVRARNTLLEGLIVWREYELQVAAFNERGTGVFSKLHYITTQEGVPVAAPSNVNVTVLSSTQIHVAFDPPPQQMILGVNQGYKVQLWRDGALLKESRVLPGRIARTEKVVGDLPKFAIFNVTVLCFTAAGDGPTSVPVEARTLEDVPGPVRNMRFDHVLFSTVRLLWDPPEHLNGILTSYTLRYWATDAPEATRVEESVAADASGFRVDELSASTRYTFELRANTAVGAGPTETATMESGVPPEPPGPPHSLLVSNVNARSAVVQFVPGYNGKTIITRWIVEAQIGESTAWVFIFNASAPNARSLTMDGLRPFTSYRIRLLAENVVSESPPSQPSDRFETLRDVPELAPSDFGAEPVSSDVISVSWTPLQSTMWNGVPRGYVLSFRISAPSADSAGGSWEVSRSASPFVSARVTVVVDRVAALQTDVDIGDASTGVFALVDLLPYTDYDVQLKAINDVGNGQSTQLITTRTYESVPSAAPRNVRATAVSSTSIRLSWDTPPPSTLNGLIVGFRVRYDNENFQLAHDRDEVRLERDRREMLVSGLRPFNSYRFAVAALTIVGDGPVNDPPVLLRTLEDVPGEPSEVLFQYVSRTEARIIWKAPYEPNGVITGYAISFRPNESDPQSAIREHFAGDLFLFVASNLKADTVYSFSVAARNAVGWGAEASVVVYTTSAKVPPPKPTAPRRSQSHPKAARRLTVEWRVADSLTAAVRLVDVDYQRASDGHWTRWRERVPGSRRHCGVDGLQPNTAYRLRMRATNDFGQSAWSAASDWIKTDESAPDSPPSAVRATPYESTALKLTWKPPPVDEWNSDLIGYRALYKVYDDANATFDLVEEPMSGYDDGTRHMIIRDLPRFKHFIVLLQAFNQQGISEYSKPDFVYVGYSTPTEAVQNLAAESKSSTQISLAWDTWKESLEPISGFRIRYKLTESDDWTEDVAKSDAKTVMIDGLKKYRQYRLVVAAFNKAGEGPDSEIMVTTQQDRPGPVGKLVFTEILLDSVQVSWAAPLEANGVIKEYIVIYDTYKLKDEYRKEIQVKAKQNSIAVGNLEENMEYTFSVRAETVVGYGPPIVGRVTIGSPDGAPEAPSRPQTFASADSVAIEWQNGAPGDSAIVGYIIQAQRLRALHVPAAASTTTTAAAATSAGGRRTRRQTGVVDVERPTHALGRWQTVTSVDGPQPRHVISYAQLQPASVYVLRVFARNQLGVGRPSPSTDEIVVPEFLAKPFYLEWWFLVILALVSVIIILIVVAVLCIAGRNNSYKYKKRASVDSLQLADGGIVTYELRASQHGKPPLHHRRTRTNRLRGADASGMWCADADSEQPYHQRRSADSEAAAAASTSGAAPPAYENVMRAPSTQPGAFLYGAVNNGGSRPPTIYGSLATDVIGADRRPADVRGNHAHLMEKSYATERTDVESSSTADEATDSEAEGGADYERDEVPSIAQHYQTSDEIYRETWRRAKRTAATSQPQPRRPPSLSSQQSESVSVRSAATQPPPPPHANCGQRAPVVGFSSFV